MSYLPSMKYRHYSFDLWLTLIRSDPAFKKARLALFQQHYNPLHKSLEEIGQALKSVDRLANLINERVGKNIDSYELYYLVLHQLGNDVNQLPISEIEQIYNYCDAQLLQHPPLVYDGHTISTLQKLKEQGFTTNILSNTGFIQGRSLRKALPMIGVAAWIDFQMYSDEEGLSKPNATLFNRLYERVRQLKGERDLLPIHILHTGDNPCADVSGAQHAGMSAALVHTQEEDSIAKVLML